MGGEGMQVQMSQNLKQVYPDIHFQMESLFLSIFHLFCLYSAYLYSF